MNRRLVLKLGTKIVTNEDGSFAATRISKILHEVLTLKAKGWEILLVTSGAVGLGRRQMNLTGPLSTEQKQVCASVGQSQLMSAYHNELAKASAEPQVVCGQILLTSDDLASRVRYLTLSRTLELMLKEGILPIINENDSVSADELSELKGGRSFGDNDRLSALVAAKLNATVLVLLTDVDGIFSDNPQTNPDAKLLARIDNIFTAARVKSKGVSKGGRGGMTTKIEAAKIATLCGVTTLIGRGDLGLIVQDLVGRFQNWADGKTHDGPGTLILPLARLTQQRRKWIGLASGFKGQVKINDGAREALRKNASLLPIGVESVTGRFEAGAVISIQDVSGAEIGRGICSFSSQELRLVQGCSSEKVKALLKTKVTAAVHKDNLVLFEGILSL